MLSGDDIARTARQAVDEELLAAGHRLAEHAKANMPVGDPALDPTPLIAMRDHVEVEYHHSQSSYRGDHVTVTVNTKYAAAQEFNMRLKHPRGGGSRFLQRALAQEAAHLNGAIAGKVRSHMARGRR